MNRKGIIIGVIILGIFLSITYAQLQIQTNLGNASQTIQKIFITSNGLTPNGSNDLGSINADNNGSARFAGNINVSGSTTLGTVNNNNSANQILAINNGTIVYRDANTLGTGGGGGTGSMSGRTIAGSYLYTTNFNIGINTPTPSQTLEIVGKALITTGTESIYLYPNNTINTAFGGLTSFNGNLKINTKNNGNLALNFDTLSDTTIYSNGSVIANFQGSNLSVGIGTSDPTHRLDVDGPVRLRTTSHIVADATPGALISRYYDPITSGVLSGAGSRGLFMHSGTNLSLGTTEIAGATISFDLYQPDSSQFRIVTVDMVKGFMGVNLTSDLTNRVDIYDTQGHKQLRLRTPYTPDNTADSNGAQGTIIRDDNYIYIKTSVGWKRAVLSTF